MSSGLTPGSGQDTTGGRRSRRMAFRVLGALFVLAALACIGVAVADLFATGDMTAEPTKFWLFFVGVPLFFVGGVLLQLGFAGAAASYIAEEYSPAMRTAAQSLGLGGQTTGPTPDQGRTGPYCRSCGRRNEADARFCDGCGTATGA